MLLFSQYMGLGHSTHTNTEMHVHARSQVLPAFLVIPQTNYNVFSSSVPLFSFSTSLTPLLLSSCNWIWIKMAFPFLLYSSLLWLKRDLPREITHNHRHTNTRTLTDCSTETLHLRKNIFTNKQRPPPPAPHGSNKLRSQRSTTSIAFAVFHCLASFLSHTLFFSLHVFCHFFAVPSCHPFHLLLSFLSSS